MRTGLFLYFQVFLCGNEVLVAKKEKNSKQGKKFVSEWAEINIKKIRNCMRIPKMQFYLSDKMHPKMFWPKNCFLEKISLQNFMFFGHNFFRSILS
jgi:hypothetical protein